MVFMLPLEHKGHTDIALKAYPDNADLHSFLIVDSGHLFLYIEITV